MSESESKPATPPAPPARTSLRLLPAHESEADAALAKAAWLAAVVDSLGQAVVGATLDGRITSWNAAAEALYGLPASEAVGNSLDLLGSAALTAQLRQIIDAVGQGQPAPELDTALLTRRDGSQVEVSANISLVRDQGGKAIGLAMVAADVTERKQAERERQKMLDDLKETLAQVRRLHGLLPICSSCKKIRDDKGHWQMLEAYITGHSQAEFSHSLCPACAQKMFADYTNDQ